MNVKKTKSSKKIVLKITMSMTKVSWMLESVLWGPRRGRLTIYKKWILLHFSPISVVLEASPARPRSIVWMG